MLLRLDLLSPRRAPPRRAPLIRTVLLLRRRIRRWGPVGALQCNYLLTKSPDLQKQSIATWSRWKLASGRLKLSRHSLQFLEFRRPHFFALSRNDWGDFCGFAGIGAFSAASPAGVILYVQPKVASRLRCSQPFESIPKIVDGPAG
jgi:hypothetical protein